MQTQTSEGYARQLDAMVDAARRWAEGHPGVRLQFNFPLHSMLIMAALSESWIEAIGGDADSRRLPTRAQCVDRRRRDGFYGLCRRR